MQVCKLYLSVSGLNKLMCDWAPERGGIGKAERGQIYFSTLQPSCGADESKENKSVLFFFARSG